MDTGSYRIPIAIQFAWAIILFAGMLILPDTPRMWIKRGNALKAAKSLSTLRRLPVDHPALVEELAEITANHEYELSLGKATYMDCFRGSLGKRLATGCLLQSLQQLTGINFIFVSTPSKGFLQRSLTSASQYYGTSFFATSGISNSFVISMITSGVNTASTFPGLYLVEAWGRRPLLLFGAAGMAVSQFIVAGVGTGVGTTNEAAQKTVVAFVCIYIFFFACSWGPVRILTPSET